jgi:hypothetical protein
LLPCVVGSWSGVERRECAGLVNRRCFTMALFKTVWLQKGCRTRGGCDEPTGARVLVSGLRWLGSEQAVDVVRELATDVLPGPALDGEKVVDEIDAGR